MTRNWMGATFAQHRRELEPMAKPGDIIKQLHDTPWNDVGFPWKLERDEDDTDA